MRAFLLPVVVIVLVGCGSSPGGPAVGGSGGQNGTGGAGPSGSGGSGGAVTGSGGGGGQPSGSGGETPIVDAQPPADTVADRASEAGPGPGCPAGAVICEDFEKYTVGTSDFRPDWETYQYGATTIQVDTTKPFKGAKSLHMTAPVGGRKYADIIKQNPLDKELLPLRHFGRVMVWLTSQPATAHWNINQASGPVPGNPLEISKYSYGGQNSVLSPNYTLRPPIGDNLTPLRGGGPQDGDVSAALFDCGPNTRTQKVPNGRWVCWEWMFDGSKNQLRLYLDGAEQTEAAVNGVAGTCGAWGGPKMFTKMIIGWEQYTEASDKTQSAWLDDLVVSAERVGCPTQ